jgi:hypothetical protein
MKGFGRADAVGYRCPVAITLLRSHRRRWCAAQTLIPSIDNLLIKLISNLH